VIVTLIAQTTPQTGLHLRAALATAADPTGLKVPNEQRRALALEPVPFHGKAWYYTIKPRPTIHPIFRTPRCLFT
jgi:Rhodopirellula transposase DDE domain